MDLRSLNRQPAPPQNRIEEILLNYYEKFFRWATVLARGDAGKAEELVQEFCLYLALAKPDLSRVGNLDGYLYISLRNLYQSMLAQSVREAMRFVHVAEFDSIRVALSGKHGGDTLDRQNDLRLICDYAVWRKDQSKSFSCFVLHFFHGYSRSEVAEMSGTSLAAIYNKLHNARTEIKTHLENSGKLRIIDRQEPPQTALFWHKISEPEFFRELRDAILRACKSPCLPEGELLAVYRASRAKPLSCKLLSHLASCERCLDIVDRSFRRPTLRGRDPLDSLEPRQRLARKQESATNRCAVQRLRMLHAKLRNTYEHRPMVLCIAVNGRIIASHDIQGARSVLAARIDPPEKANFVEVFSEQDVRLASLSVSAAPPEGEHTVTQRVHLSDERWLELNLAFDGLGLKSEVTYFDPVLGIVAEPEEADEPVISEPPVLQRATSSKLISQPAGRRTSDWLRKLIPSPVFSWTLALLVVFCSVGYFTYRHASAPLSAQRILDLSMKLEAATLKGQTEHQMLQVEEISASGQIAQKGTIEVWKDGNGDRFLRKFYDSRHHLIAAEWRIDKNSHRYYQRKDVKELAIIPWTQDMSAHSFAKLSKQPPQMHQNENDYRLTVAGPVQSQPHLVSATLVLTRRLTPAQEIFRLRHGNAVYSVRLAQLTVSYTPSNSIPNGIFEPSLTMNAHDGPVSLLTHSGSVEQLASLDIAVLYQLSQMNADTVVPIAVQPTAGGHLRIVGSIANPELRNRLLARLRTLPGNQLLEIDLAAQDRTKWAGLQSLHSSSGPLKVYETGGARPIAGMLIRNHFMQQGLTGTQLKLSVSQFSSGVLGLSQHTLQNAYALDRLGKAISISGIDTLNPPSLDEWTEMVTKHASLLETELRLLRAQLNSILPPQQRVPQTEGPSAPINNSREFSGASRHLLQQVQEVSHSVDQTFASQGVEGGSQNGESMVTSTVRMLPIQEASTINALAKRLSETDPDIRAAEDASETSERPTSR